MLPREQFGPEQFERTLCEELLCPPGSIVMTRDYAEAGVETEIRQLPSKYAVTER